MKILSMISLLVILTSLVFSQSVEIKDGESNVLTQFNDEGTAGSISLPDAGAVDPSTNKLYNNAGSLYWDGSEVITGGATGWTDGGTEVYITTTTDNVGIGTLTPEGKLDITSTLGALIVPRMTSTQRDALPEINGSIIYNTTAEQFNFRENGSWVTK